MVDTCVNSRFSQAANTELRDTCDVCIIGAGAAGCYLARRLAAGGLDVVILEAGGSTGTDSHALGFTPQFLTNYYPGAIEGRAFGLGGTTSRWGGLLIPHSRHDLQASQDEALDSTWEHIVDIASSQSDRVLAQLGYSRHAEFDTYPKTQLNGQSDALRRAGIDVLASVFLPVRRKNLLHLLGRQSQQGRGVRVYTNAVAKDWQFADSGAEQGTIRNLQAVSRDGAILDVQASRFIIAAGTIESARILLELQSQVPNGLRLSEDVGKFLGDHLSIGIAEVAEESLQDVTREYAPRFQGPWMRSFRFLETNPPADAPRAFTHFVFENESAGFQLAKKVMSAIQAKRIPKVNLSELVLGVRGVLALAFGRFLLSRLYLPKGTTTRLQLDIEQSRNAENQIVLGHEHDAYGRRVVQIDWRISQTDMNNICSTANRIIEQWNRNSGDLPRLIPRELRLDSQKPHDAYHPVGTCRMGADDASVVDLNLRVRGLRNLWLVSTGVLPSAGTANPTMTLLCLAEQLAHEMIPH
jgi:choline dehydrogenase-like flavoprotein